MGFNKVKMNLIAIALLVMAYVDMANLASVNVINRCPRVPPMRNLDLNRIQGTWYILGGDQEFLGYGRCSKMTEILSKDNKTLSLREEYIDPNNQTIVDLLNFDVNQTSPGLFSAMVDTDVQNILGATYKQKIPMVNVVLFTDYDKIQVRYQCSEIENYWYTDINEDYYILVRNRTYDEWRPMSFIFRLLDRITDIDTFLPYRYDPMSCPNN